MGKGMSAWAKSFEEYNKSPVSVKSPEHLSAAADRLEQSAEKSNTERSWEKAEEAHSTASAAHAREGNEKELTHHDNRATEMMRRATNAAESRGVGFKEEGRKVPSAELRAASSNAYKSTYAAERLGTAKAHADAQGAHMHAAAIHGREGNHDLAAKHREHASTHTSLGGGSDEYRRDEQGRFASK